MIDSHNWATYSNPGPGRGAGGRRQGLVGNTQTISTARLEAAARPAGPGRTTSRRAEQPISTPRATGVEGTGRSKRPGRGAGGRRQGQGGPRDRSFRAAGSRVAISRAGRRPPAHTAARARQRGGYRSTRPFSTHSATASSRLRPNGCQSWRRRRIHRNMPPTTAAPRPAPPIRPSKPVRARPFFGLVAGTSGAT